MYRVFSLLSLSEMRAAAADEGGAGGVDEARALPSFAPRSVRRALLTLQVSPGSRYRCGKSD